MGSRLFLHLPICLLPTAHCLRPTTDNGQLTTDNRLSLSIDVVHQIPWEVSKGNINRNS
jgi:hypothetical protein